MRYALAVVFSFIAVTITPAWAQQDQDRGRASRIELYGGYDYIRFTTNPVSTLRYRKGFRFGNGPVLAVVRPGNLVEQWRVLKACVAASKIIIMQGANTGLTGGSTPDGSDYDRDIVIVSTLRIAKIRPINGGRQVICHSGSTLMELEKALKPLGREPHSVITCIGASVVGGICNNSGGALVRRGSAYTQLAVFASVDETGAIQLVNHLGVKLGNDPEKILDALDRDAFDEYSCSRRRRL